MRRPPGPWASAVDGSSSSEGQRPPSGGRSPNPYAMTDQTASRDVLEIIATVLLALAAVEQL